MENKEIVQSYICEALRQYKLKCLENKEEVNQEVANLFTEIINNIGKKE